MERSIEGTWRGLDLHRGACPGLGAAAAQALSRVCLFVVPWTVACHTPLSKELSKQEYWSGLSFPTPENLPDPGIESSSPALAGGCFTTEPPSGSLLLDGRDMQTPGPLVNQYDHPSPHA